MDIIDRITGLFHKPSPEPLPELDAQLALAGLLVRVAKSDLTYRVEEISRIDTILADIFSLNPIEAAKLRATSEKLEATAPETSKFAELIRNNVSEAERLKTLKAMRSVMLADDIAMPEEQSVIQSTCVAFGFDLEVLATLSNEASE